MEGVTGGAAGLTPGVGSGKEGAVATAGCPRGDFGRPRGAGAMGPDRETAPGWTSRFATTPEDHETILDLRRRAFAAGVVSSDATYRACWRRNGRSMKLVRDREGRPTGYWGLIPIGRDAFAAFAAGGETHARMLAEACLAWDAADPGELYLYVIGIVVPDAKAGAGRARGYALDRSSAAVLLDAFAFGLELAHRARVAGVCGYPSRVEGFRIFRRAMDIEPSAVLIDGEPSQPVFAREGAGLGAVRRRLQSHLDRNRPLVPAWDAGDREAFFAGFPD